MPKLTIIKAAVVVEEVEPRGVMRGEHHIVSLVDGVPAALDGVAPIITVQVVDPERDAGRLLRAAEELLPIYRQAPGVVVLDGEDTVQGIITRADLEKAVLQMRRRDYAALAEGLGLRADYRPPPGDPVPPFVYWRCPQCQHVYVPQVGHEDDPPPPCPRHTPPVQMERRVHGGV
jgi:hypothetical protein